MAPEAICWRAPFVLPLHARFGHRSRITGNTAITGTLLFVSPTTTVSVRERGGHRISISVRESEVCYEEERVKSDPGVCREMKTLAEMRSFFSQWVLPKLKWLPLDSLGDIGNAAVPASLNDTD